MYTRVLGVVVIASAAAVVVVRAATAPEPPAPRAATKDDRRAMALAVAAEEPEWRAKAEEAFPSDDWSQRDDFHSREAAKIRELSNQRGVPYEDVLRAIDDDLHTRARGRTGRAVGDARGARAVPCKPRPFYD
jgi:hypothetical protein